MIASLKAPELIVADTMNLWIEHEKPELLRLLGKVHGLVLNDGEARMLTGKKNLVQAAKDVLKLGPRFVVIKKGEHGSLMCSGDETVSLPAFPLEEVVDPTGAGDSFAAGMMGYLATQGNCNPATLRRALAYGTVVASYTVSDFSLGALQRIGRADLDRRLMEYGRVMQF